MSRRVSTMVCLFLALALQAHGTTAKRIGKNPKLQILLPEAQVGIPYSKTIILVSTIPYGHATCKLDNAPSWLIFNGQSFEVSGVPDESRDSAYNMVLTMSYDDNDGKPLRAQTVDILLSVFLKPELVSPVAQKMPKRKAAYQSAGGPGTVINAPSASVAQVASAAPPAGAAKTPAMTFPMRYSPKLRITSDVQEGSTSISGEVERIPTGATLPVVEIWLRSDDQARYRATLNLKDSEGNPYTGAQQTISEKDHSFTASLATPLIAGECIEVALVSPDGSGLVLPSDMSESSLSKQLPTEIPWPEIIVPEDLTVGMASISGYVRGLPPVLITATSADAAHNLPATPGNLPLIAVDIRDPVQGSANASMQLSFTSTVTAIQVNPDGSFKLALAKPLAAGQTVRLVPMAPTNHHFSGRGPGPGWERSLKDETSIEPAEGPRPIEHPVHAPLPVFTPVTLSKPTITSTLANSTITISGTATASASGGTNINVALLLLAPDIKKDQEPLAGNTSCPTIDDLETSVSRRYGDYQLITGSSSTSKTVATTSTGTFSLTLTTPLLESERFRIVQVLPAGTRVQPQQYPLCFSEVYTVPSLADWGRIHVDLTAGLLISNSSTGTSGGDFSEAHQFLALTVDKTWAFPGNYLSGPSATDKKCHTSQAKACNQDHEEPRFFPGINTFFETRLTAIPVSTASSSGGTSGTASSTATTTTASTYTLSSGQLVSAQTARVDVGLYFPFLLTRWDYHRQPNALFLAPLVKAGFDSVLDSSNQTVLLPNGIPGTLNFENLYNFYAFGGRIGHFQLTRTTNHAPETFSYLDVMVGPFSNLQSDICKRTPVTRMANDVPPAGMAVPGFPLPLPASNMLSSCWYDYPAFYNAAVPAGTVPATNISTGGTIGWAPYDSRKRLYRLDFEGLLKIPNTPLYVGFNANLAQKTLGADHLDHGFAAPDDLRFFFGTKFDLGATLSKLGISPF